MRTIICVAGMLALASVGTQAAAKTGTFQLNKTTWTMTDKQGTKVRESIDADGNYIVETRAGKHLDHGTAVMKGTKACFTSAMTGKGEVCWTTRPVKIGHSMTTTSDKGEKEKVTRVAYRQLKMPK